MKGYLLMNGSLKHRSKALSVVEKRRMENEAKAEARKDEIYEKLPRLRQIEKELAQTSILVAKTVLRGTDIEANVLKLKDKSLTLQAERKAILSENGYSENDLKPRYFCQKCNDTGRVGGALCQCVKNEAIKLAYEEMSMGSIIENCSFSSFQLSLYPDKATASGKSARDCMQSVYERAMEFCEDPDGKNLLFIGKTGLGKTHLSLSIAKDLLSRGKTVLYMSAGKMFSLLEKDRFGRPEDSEGTLENILQSDVLIIDDLGTEMKTGFTLSALYQIINGRINENKSTIINTNLSVAELKKEYDDRICSRLFGCFESFLFLGEDIRLKKRG
jgi:DNA replication protein DnaC